LGEIVNLRLARKRKGRAAQAQRGAENRALHGTPRAERERREAEEKRQAACLDGHRRTPEGQEPTG